MIDTNHDARVRKAAFDWLADEVARHGDVLPRTLLAKGLQFEGQRVPLLGPQGIFKPRVLARSASVDYDRAERTLRRFFRPSGLRYRYRGKDPNHPDNRGLRTAMQRRLPLIYFHGVVEGKYLAAWPVFVVGDDPAGLAFTIAVDDARHLGLLDEATSSTLTTGDEGEEIRRAYTTAAVRVRLHQRAFRERVLEAYKRQCAFCRLRHDELLDAAHLIPDADPAGDPAVRNGVALCALHHAAFDRYFIGIRPDYVIEVREDLLHERDGPTLAHAIQGLHGGRLILPSRREHMPARDSLEARYELLRRSFPS